MDLKEEVQKLLNEDPNLDEDQADMLKAAACLLAAAANPSQSYLTFLALPETEN